MTTVPDLTAADTVKLSGCLIQGEGDGAGYLLSMSPASLGLARRMSSLPEGPPEHRECSPTSSIGWTRTTT